MTRDLNFHKSKEVYIYKDIENKKALLNIYEDLCHFKIRIRRIKFKKQTFKTGKLLKFVEV